VYAALQHDLFAARRGKLLVKSREQFRSSENFGVHFRAIQKTLVNCGLLACDRNGAQLKAKRVFSSPMMPLCRRIARLIAQKSPRKIFLGLFAESALARLDWERNRANRVESDSRAARSTRRSEDKNAREKVA